MTRRWVVAQIAVLALVASTAPLIVESRTAAAAPSAGSGITREARRVDRVPTPKPRWFDCAELFGSRAKCATVRLPRDYDKPRGAKTPVAMLRIKARDRARKIGTLFVNPGGPGGSGVDFAAAAPFFLPPALRDRFDIVGFDPRGTNFSRNVRCWRGNAAQASALAAQRVAFPWKARQEKAYIRSARKVGRACSTTGRPLSRSMSTAEVARDMDVLRRVVGDRKLTYLGFSYGTYLGNVYANMFPRRARAMVLDGVLDPTAWTGTRRTKNLPVSVRLKSGEGATRALREILKRCRKAGDRQCRFARAGHPQRNYQTMVTSLKRAPLVVRDPDFGRFKISYATLVQLMTNDLYSPDAAAYVDFDLSFIHELMQSQAGRSTGTSERASAWLVQRLGAEQSARKAAKAARARQGGAFGFGFPYDNSVEAYQAVLCTDSLNPRRATRWRRAADFADRRAADFGRFWTWASASCARATWTARDEDAYRGPFTRRTAKPVLFIGSYWDPATNYDGAVKASSLLPNSRLLASDNWGHTAFGTSKCVTQAVSRYLLDGTLPPKGTVCIGDIQPFTDRLGPGLRTLPPGAERSLPPVVPPVPGALPRT